MKISSINNQQNINHRKPSFGMHADSIIIDRINSYAREGVIGSKTLERLTNLIARSDNYCIYHLQFSDVSKTYDITVRNNDNYILILEKKNISKFLFNRTIKYLSKKSFFKKAAKIEKIQDKLAQFNSVKNIDEIINPYEKLEQEAQSSKGTNLMLF